MRSDPSREEDLGVDICISTPRVSRVSTADLPLSGALHVMLAPMIMSFSVSSVVLRQESGVRSQELLVSGGGWRWRSVYCLR